MPAKDRWPRRVIGSAGLTFVFSLLFSYLAESVLTRLTLIFLSFLLLVLIIAVGVVFDMIGFAAAAAELAPLNARAASKVWGARQAVRLVRNADQVAVFCSDVMGDISSTLAGALGATIVFGILAHHPHLEEGLLTSLVTAAVAAASVGGKALGKGLALREATEIIFFLGKILAWLERILGREFFRPPRGAKGKGK